MKVDYIIFDKNKGVIMLGGRGKAKQFKSKSVCRGASQNSTSTMGA